MTPTPDKKKALKKFNSKALGSNNVERTAEKYSQFYSDKIIDSDYESEEEEELEEQELSGDEDSDDDDIGVLNLSNHDLNDDDEVLQGAAMYTTPENKKTTQTAKKNTNKTFNFSKNPLPTTYLPKETTQEKEKKNVLTGNKGSKSFYRMSKTPLKAALKTRKTEKNGEKETETKHAVKSQIECKFMEEIRDKEMLEITAQIKTLNGELKYFEEITGKRCIFETEVKK